MAILKLPKVADDTVPRLLPLDNHIIHYGGKKKKKQLGEKIKHKTISNKQHRGYFEDQVS